MVRSVIEVIEKRVHCQEGIEIAREGPGERHQVVSETRERRTNDNIRGHRLGIFMMHMVFACLSEAVALLRLGFKRPTLTSSDIGS